MIRRQVVDAIAFKHHMGRPGMDLTEHFGSWKSVHNHIRKQAKETPYSARYKAGWTVSAVI